MALIEPLDLSDTTVIAPGVRLWPRDASNPQLAAAQPPLTQAPRRALDDHLLVWFPQGAFLSTDRVQLVLARRDGSDWRFVFRLARAESFDGLPARGRLCLLIELTLAEDDLQSLHFELSGLPELAVASLALRVG